MQDINELLNEAIEYIDDILEDFDKEYDRVFFIVELAKKINERL
jgi:hypothetical protein